ncbi:reverse transcriptase domain-containing protein [Tanacetum coccineum]
MITTNNHNNDMKIRGKTPAWLTLRDLERRSHMGDLNPYALNAIITTMVHVLPNATSATELAIWPMTIRVPPMPTLLIWWNSHVKTVGHDVAYPMTWTDLKKKMTDKYCPRVEIKKLEVELWNLKVKGTDVIGYNQRFEELALLCVRMFPEESDKIKRYVGGLPDMIHGSVVASKPKTMQEAIEIATKLMDNKIHTFAERQTKNKRKQDDNHQQP